MENNFTQKLYELVIKNLSNESFGVSELANEIGMSRSNLLRRIQKDHNCSASQYIRQIRLEEALKILKSSDSTVSEVSYMVGFSSTSYFIKCFREQYGYSPGETGKMPESEEKEYKPTPKSKNKLIIILVSFVVFIAASLFFILKSSSTHKPLEKSIAVLPFKNDSNDSSNIYVINGLMESILNDLQSLKELKVISRTSVEKFRNSNLTIPEIAEELNVNYIVEGSGQKMGNQILLSVQLIEAHNDTHLWSKQYNRQTEDIFAIQSEVAQKIADAIQIIISPEEQQRIESIPTENIMAYDLYLKGINEFNKESNAGLIKGINYLREAITADPDFAKAHAGLALAYYYLDLFEIDKIHTDSLIYFADKALLLDPKLAAGLNAKALYYIRIRDYKQAVDYLEQALEYNPNSAMVINTLSDLYTNHLPNTEKYLEYALKGISLDIASYDSVTTSYIYLHLSNALIQTGFIKESLRSIDKSLQYNPQNLFSEYVKAYILYANNQNLDQTIELLLNALAKDTTRFDIMQEIGNVYYYQRNWPKAYDYFTRYLKIQESLQQDIFIHKYEEIGFVFDKMGYHDKANEYYQRFKNYVDNDHSIYKHLHLAFYHANKGNTQEAIDHLRIFSIQENFQYWTVLFIPMDPLFDNLKKEPEFEVLMKQISENFWNNHKRLKERLNEEHLIDIL